MRGPDSENWITFLLVPFIATAIAIYLGACGGSSSSSPVLPADNSPAILSWVQPRQFSDNTPLDLRRDIDLYEIHASTLDNCRWGDNTLVAYVHAVDNVGDPMSRFGLSRLTPYGIGPGDNGTYVTVRTVGIDCAASGFGKPCWWEGRQ